MFDQYLADLYNDPYGHKQDLFIKGFGDYRILKLSNETIIFHNKKELYRYNEKHTEFLKFLPLITDKLNQLEEDLKKYYNGAASYNYDSILALKQIIEITKQLSEMHIFFCYYDNALLYIRRVLYEYFCGMVEYRFINYLQSHVPVDSPINLQILEDFRVKDKKFFANLFCPIIELMERNNKSARSCKETDVVGSQLNEMWNYFGYASHCTNALNEYTKEDALEKYRRTNYIDYIEKDMLKKFILYKLKYISDAFTDYYSIFAHIQDYYPDIAKFHPYALILSNNSPYIKLIESCTFYSKYQTLKAIINYYIQKKDSVQCILPDLTSQLVTDNIYECIKDSIDADDKTKSKIINELFSYYPKALEEKMGAELIEFKIFEQLIAIELLDIIENKLIVKKCPGCNEYFITSSKKQKYCNRHKNKHSSYKKTCPKKTETFYQSI